MKRRLAYLFIYLSINGQNNLVPNYSFEDTAIGNNCWVQMGLPDGSFSSIPPLTKNWYTYKYMSLEYHNICANNFSGNPPPVPSSVPYSCEGYQQPRTGDSYIGSALYFADKLPDTTNIHLELAVVKLKETLKTNTCYYGEFYYSFGDVNTMSINQLGMLFTQTTNTANPFVFDNTSPYQIQADTTTFLGDTLNWVKISGYFVAQGNEEYLTIGNIRDGAHLKKSYVANTYTTPCQFQSSDKTVYVYIDDVSLYELPNHTGAQSYTLCAGDSMFLGDTVSLPMRYQWSLNGVVVDTTKNITVKNAGTYILNTQHCTTQSQTITVTVNNFCNYTEPVIPNVFTPNGDGVNDVFEFKVPSLENFSVYNRWGLEILNVASAPLSHQTANEKTVTWDGRTTSGIECSAGVYFYVLEYINPNGELKKKNGYISLIR